MKRLLFLISIVASFVYSCQKKDQPFRVDESADYKKGESFIFKQNDSAFYYFNRVASGSSDSLLGAMAHNQLAAIQSDAGDYFGSQESLTISLGFLDEENPKHRYCLASDYNELGINSYNLKSYAEALRFYDKALELSSDEEFRLVILNNKALVYQRQGAYPQAIRLYDSVITRYHKNPVSYARVLSNRAKTKWLRDPQYPAAPEFFKALEIRKNENDRWGQISSFAHLADYYSGSRPDSALTYARMMYALAKEMGSPEDQQEALQKLIRLSSPQEIRKYFSVYQNISDSVQTARNAAKNRYALIRFEAERHKAENLELQKENAEQEYQILGATLLIIGGTVFFVFWYRKRKQRLKLEAENAIKENELRISKKLHDVVANGLYRIMSEIENDVQVDKDHLLDKIEDIYERSRDLSYEKNQFSDGRFHQTITALMTSFATSSTKVLVLGNNEHLWTNVSSDVRTEVANVVQELMVNMKKHSQAGNVIIRFGQDDKNITIRYTDDGVGLPEDLVFGNGLSNTGNRMDSIGGAINFDRNAQKGTEINISFPAC